METYPNSCNRMKAMDGRVSLLINVQLCSEVVVRRRSELDERISKSDIGITIF